MGDIQVGIAGTGFIGPAHLEGLRRNHIKVVGLAEMTADLAQKKAAELGIEKAYSSFEAMLADPDIHVVHLATPNHLHYPHAKAALLAGKHVVCEKPLAMNTRESSELVKLAAEKHLVNAINFNLRFYPISQQVHSMVQSGELGQIFIMQGSYLQDWLFLPTDWNWRLEPDLGGSLRAVADIGSHWMDLITFITGLRIDSVMADFKTFHPIRKKPSKPVETYTGKMLQPEDYVDQPIKTEDYASILLRYENGAHGVLTVSQVSAGRKNSIQYEIDGSTSAVAWDSETPDHLWIGHRGRPNEILQRDPGLMTPMGRSAARLPGGHVEGFADTFAAHFIAIYDDVLAGRPAAKPAYATFADGHREMLFGDAVIESARTSGWVKVPDGARR